VAEHEAVLPIHSVTSGEGTPVVLIHGAFTTHCDWPPAMTGPAAKLGRVIAIDRPGHGKSPRRRYDSDARAQATQIRDGLGLEQPALLVAHSFGALTALAYAEQYPDEVAAMLLIAPVCFPEWRMEQLFLGPRAMPIAGPRISRAANMTVDAGYLALIQDQMFAPQPVPPAWRASHPLEALLAPDRFVREGEDSWASSPLSFGAYRRARPSLPLTIMQGEADHIIVNGWHALLLKWFAPDIRLVWMKGVGHMAHYAEPARVVAEIARLVGARTR